MGLMLGPRTEEQWRWAEALALEKLHGPGASRFIAERIAARMHDIARVFETMLMARCAGAQ